MENLKINEENFELDIDRGELAKTVAEFFMKSSQYDEVTYFLEQAQNLEIDVTKEYAKLYYNLGEIEKALEFYLILHNKDNITYIKEIILCYKRLRNRKKMIEYMNKLTFEQILEYGLELLYCNLFTPNTTQAITTLSSQLEKYKLKILEKYKE